MNSNLLTSITENKPSVRLIDQILRLGEDEFYTIAARRLNLPLSESKIKELRITDQDKREYYTEEYLVDKLSIELAATKDNIVMNDGKLVSVRKYYNQALRIGKYIPVARPVPEFIINISDLSPRIALELKSLAFESRCSYNYVLKQAVGRIFENIEFRQYHQSIARKLKVRLDR